MDFLNLRLAIMLACYELSLRILANIRFPFWLPFVFETGEELYEGLYSFSCFHLILKARFYKVINRKSSQNISTTKSTLWNKNAKVVLNKHECDFNSLSRAHFQMSYLLQMDITILIRTENKFIDPLIVLKIKPRNTIYW